MSYKRKTTRKVKLGDIYIGGDTKITIQSMTNTDTRDVKKTVEQIKQLENAGCDIIRCAVPDKEAAIALSDIKKQINIPLIADIHYDYRLALLSLENGADKIRINPGNIGSIERVNEIVKLAKKKNAAIRIGVNSGSIEKDILAKYMHPTAQGMVESIKKYLDMIEKMDFYDIVLSLKASNVPMTVDAYKIASESFDYPLHIGVTEAGTVKSGTIKSAVGIGILLSQGIGDTIRVSLTGDPVEEVYTGKAILKSLNLINSGPEIISCPTCGRTCIDLISIAEKVEKAVSNIDKNIKIAVMGCAVNGPGEAKEADIGIAGGNGCALIFKKGEIVKKVKEEDIVYELLNEIEKIN